MVLGKSNDMIVKKIHATAVLWVMLIVTLNAHQHTEPDRGRAVNLTTGNALTLPNFPYHVKKNVTLSAQFRFTEISGNVKVGKGSGEYRGAFIEITPTNLICRFQTSATELKTIGSEAHGLRLQDFATVSIVLDHSGLVYVALHTKNGLFKTAFQLGYEFNYAPFIQTEGQTITDVYLTAGNMDFKQQVWAFGDSYFGIAPNRWVGVMRDLGFFNFMVDGLAGINSTNSIIELKRCLVFGTPKYLIWCLGMNDSADTTYESVLDSVKRICETKGIELILATIPTVPARDKAYITNLVRNSGYRYIDFCKAVGADSSENWIPGYLATDGVHPTASGASALAMQVLVDFPELMQYGLVSTESVITGPPYSHTRSSQMPQVLP